MNITAGFETLWGAFTTVVEWTQTHGITIHIGNNNVTVSYFAIAVSLTVFGIVLNNIPIFGGDNDDE